MKIFKKLFSKSFLNGARTLACGKLQLCLVGLRLHFPSENRQSCTEPRTNARPSGLATPLQNREASLLDFGQSQHFPNVGKCCALSLPAVCGRSNYNFAVIAITLLICYNVLKEGENEQLKQILHHIYTGSAWSNVDIYNYLDISVEESEKENGIFEWICNI